MTPDPSTALLVTILLIGFNAFFVASEFALVKVRQSQLALKEKEGHKSAKLAKHIVEHLEKYLSATQLAITGAGLALWWIGQDAMSALIYRWASIFWLSPESNIVDTLAFPLAFALLTFIQILIGELLPKCIAIQNPLKYTLMIAWPLRIFYIIFSPFIWLLQVSSSGLMKLIGMSEEQRHNLHTEEEIKLLLTESEEGGVIGEASNELIQNVFEFDDRTVRQIYVPRSRMFALDIEEDFDVHFATIVREGYSRIPVYRDSLDNIVWVVYLKDFLPALKEHGTVDLHKLMRPAHFAPQSQKIEQLLKDFQRLHIQMAIVTNEHGETAGIITLEDIVEELVGEIQDEHDTEEALVIEKRPGTYVIRPEASIADVNDYLPHPLPESHEYETISGFTNSIFGHIPHAGETIEYGEYDVTVLRRGKNAVELIKIQVQK